jgi:hypothetical protein
MQDTSLILRDIHDLDVIPWWPLAPGWWWIIGIVTLLVLVAGIRYRVRYSGILPGWRGDARRKLRLLKKALRTGDARDIAGQLSTLLRRMAMAHAGRHHAAGLSGEAWLAWLEANDGSGFHWTKDGKVLLQAPYMPPDMPVRKKDISQLLAAATRWLDSLASPGIIRSLARPGSTRAASAGNGGEKA